MSPSKRFTEEQLDAVRRIPIVDAIEKLGLYYTKDPDYRPIKDKSSVRLNVSVKNTVFELIVTGSHFYDTREDTGRGGAIDLAMYLLGCDFKTAVRKLLSSD